MQLICLLILFGLITVDDISQDKEIFAGLIVHRLCGQWSCNQLIFQQILNAVVAEEETPPRSQKQKSLKVSFLNHLLANDAIRGKKNCTDN